MKEQDEYRHIVTSIRKSLGARSVLLLVLGGESESGFYALMDKSDKRQMVDALRELADGIEVSVDLGPTTVTR